MNRELKKLWNKTLKLIGTEDYYSPSDKKLFSELYEYLECQPLREIEILIKIIKPMYEKQFNNPIKRKYTIIEEY